jgi:hypothetical protein
MTVKDVVSFDMLSELIAEPQNTRGYAKEIIAEFANDTDEPAWIDLSTLPALAGKSANNIKQTFLNNLPPKNEKAPSAWERIVVRTPYVENENGEKKQHCWLLHMDRVAALQAQNDKK